MNDEKNSSKSFWNALLIIFAIISSVIGLVPSNINPEWRIILIISSPIILVIACFFIFLNNQDDILKRISNLEDNLKKNYDLINIKADIEYLKRKK